MATEQVNIQPEEPKEDSTHQQEMVNKADGVEGEQEQKLLAGKYKTEDDLQNAVFEILKKQNNTDSLEDIYKSLESSLGKAQDTSDSEDTEQEVKPKENTFDFSKFETELGEKGELSEDSYKELQDQGIPKQIVDGYIEGMKLNAERQAQEVFSITDGQENYASMIEWAAEGLSEREQQVYNESVNAGMEQAKFAVEALYSRYLKANGGSAPKSLVQGSPSQLTSDRYESLAQMKADMSDPKYQTDDAFRRKVQDKLSRSNIL